MPTAFRCEELPLLNVVSYLLSEIREAEPRRPRQIEGKDEEKEMAKGQVRSSKETKKPKSDKPKGPGSPYKQSMTKGGPLPIAPTKKGP
jgi:hypothetical protein